MAGTMSVLGLGSNSGLTNETLEKLRKVDTDAQVKPFETKIKNNKTRQSDLGTLRGIAQSLRALTRSLSGEVNYLERNFSLTGDAASITAESGTSLQAFDLDVEQLASRDIYESKSFAAKNSKLNAGKLDIAMDGKTYSIEVTQNMSLEDLRDKVYETTGGKVTASVMKTGGAEPYKFVLKSTDTGAKNAFTISGSSATELGLDTSSAKVQNAANSRVKYNGVTIERATNEINDLIPGVNIKLNKLGKVSANITQKTSGITEKVENFVKKYNELLANLHTVTKYDTETKKSGTFQGNSQINSIARALGDALLANSSKSLSDFGISVQRNGELKLDKSKLESQLKKDFNGVKEFFVGKKGKEGVFKNLDNALDKITTSKNGTFKLVETNLKNNAKSLKSGMESAQKRLDSKYEIMQKQFAAYDAIIAKMKANFNALKAMIDAQNQK